MIRSDEGEIGDEERWGGEKIEGSEVKIWKNGKCEDMDKMERDLEN